MGKLTNEKLMFERIKNYKGFNIKAYVGDEPNARIEIYKNGNLYKEFNYPGYKIYNLQAHFTDIVNGELENSDEGYKIAGSTGLGGVIMPEKIVNQ